MKRITASFVLLAGLMTAVLFATAPGLASAQPLSSCSYPCIPPTSGLVSAQPLSVAPPTAQPPAAAPLTQPSQLAFTGIDAVGIAIFALVLVSAGVVTLRISRRRNA